MSSQLVRLKLKLEKYVAEMELISDLSGSMTQGLRQGTIMSENFLTCNGTIEFS